MDVGRVRDAYGSASGLYIELFGTLAAESGEELGFIRRHVGIPGGRVLDLGCGPGHLTAYLRSLGADAAGLDLVPEFIAHARAAHPDVEYQLGSMTSLDAADHSVAGILAWFSLIHLPPEELDGVLAELRRVLAPGGRIVAGFFEGDEVAAFDHKVVTAYRWPVAEFSGRLAAAGFTELERLSLPGDATRRPQAAIAARLDLRPSS